MRRRLPSFLGLSLTLALSGCWCRTSCVVPERCAPERPSAVPVALLRAFHTDTGDHLYTTDQAELKDAVGRLGYVAEESSVGVYTMQASGTVPLWRLWRLATNDHFYTTDTDERVRAVRDLGYRSEGITGYVFAETRPGTVPLLRSLQPRTGHHLYTADAREHVTALHDLGFVDEGIACYTLAPSPNVFSAIPFPISDSRETDPVSNAEVPYVIVHTGVNAQCVEERAMLADLGAVCEGQLSVYIAVPKSSAREAIRRILASRFREHGIVTRLESLEDK